MKVDQFVAHKSHQNMKIYYAAEQNQFSDAKRAWIEGTVEFMKN